MSAAAVMVQFNAHFKAVNRSKRRYRALRGSAGSGKSVNIAQDYILKLGDPKYAGANLLCVRKVNETNRNSTFAELTGAINRIFGEQADEYWEILRSPLTIRSRVTGNEVIFRGMNDVRDREKVKSINFAHGKLVWIWVEEATELQESDVDILDDRLRGVLLNPNLYYQITFTFNPVSAQHWIKRKYFDRESPDVLTHHSTYRTNRFIDPAYFRRMERRKIEDPEGYAIYGEGEWGELGGLIFKNFIIHDFDTSFEMFDSMQHGQDFGFNHANAILTVGVKDGEFLFATKSMFMSCRQTRLLRSPTGRA